jgi:hypothetical protein
MRARMGGGLLQDTVSPLGDMVHFCFSVLRQFKFVKPTRQPGEKNEQVLKNKVVFSCYQQKFDPFHLSTKKILNKENKFKIIARIIENIILILLHSQHN